MTFFRISELTAVDALPGVRRRAVTLNGVMLTFFSFEPEAVVPDHSHPHEQITVVSSGALEFTLAGETRVLRAGDGVCVPANVPHSARVIEGPVEVSDAWHPPRGDYLLPS